MIDFTRGRPVLLRPWPLTRWWVNQPGDTLCYVSRRPLRVLLLYLRKAYHPADFASAWVRRRGKSKVACVVYGTS